MQSPTSLFDIIDTKERRYIGIIDFVNSKYVTFYDMSNLADPNLTHLAILYKTYYPTMRFSVFVATHAPQFDFGNPVSINKKLIEYHSRPLHPTLPTKKVSKMRV